MRPGTVGDRGNGEANFGTMTSQTTMKIQPLPTFALKVLAALHHWTGRQYRRELLRQELARIGQEIQAEGWKPAVRSQGSEGRKAESRRVTSLPTIEPCHQDHTKP